MRAFLQKFTRIRLIERVNGPFTVVDRKKVLLNVQDANEPGTYTTSVVFGRSPGRPPPRCVRCGLAGSRRRPGSVDRRMGVTRPLISAH